MKFVCIFVLLMGLLLPVSAQADPTFVVTYTDEQPQVSHTTVVSFKFCTVNEDMDRLGGWDFRWRLEPSGDWEYNYTCPAAGEDYGCAWVWAFDMEGVFRIQAPGCTNGNPPYPMVNCTTSYLEDGESESKKGVVCWGEIENAELQEYEW